MKPRRIWLVAFLLVSNLSAAWGAMPREYLVEDAHSANKLSEAMDRFYETLHRLERRKVLDYFLIDFDGVLANKAEVCEGAIAVGGSSCPRYNLGAWQGGWAIGWLSHDAVASLSFVGIGTQTTITEETHPVGELVGRRDIFYALRYRHNRWGAYSVGAIMQVREIGKASGGKRDEWSFDRIHIHADNPVIPIYFSSLIDLKGALDHMSLAYKVRIFDWWDITPKIAWNGGYKTFDMGFESAFHFWDTRVGFVDFVFSARKNRAFVRHFRVGLRSPSLKWYISVRAEASASYLEDEVLNEHWNRSDGVWGARFLLWLEGRWFLKEDPGVWWTYLGIAGGAYYNDSEYTLRNPYAYNKWNGYLGFYISY